MAFPLDSDKQFETGDVSEFDSETDGNSVLNVRSYKWLAKHGAVLELPYRGAYCMHIDLSGADTNQYLQENDDFDVTAGNSLSFGFYFYFKDMTSTLR